MYKLLSILRYRCYYYGYCNGHQYSADNCDKIINKFSKINNKLIIINTCSERWCSSPYINFIDICENGNIIEISDEKCYGWTFSYNNIKFHIYSTDDDYYKMDSITCPDVEERISYLKKEQHSINNLINLLK